MNRSTGVGFAQMAIVEQGKKAKEALDGKDYDGRPLNVKPAHPPRYPRAAHAAPNLTRSDAGSR